MCYELIGALNSFNLCIKYFLTNNALNSWMTSILWRDPNYSSGFQPLIIKGTCGQEGRCIYSIYEIFIDHLGPIWLEF